MSPKNCAACREERAVIIRPKNRQKLCKTCFIAVFEQEVHETITSSQLFHQGERIAIGASGGKDSTVLASLMKTLNDRHSYGLDLVLLSIDEGIKGYRDDSLETVKRNALQYDMPLLIVGYDELYGWTMDEVVGEIGKKGNCTYCGVFRRQALDRGASRLAINHVVTGHNADDVAETVLMNLLRGDLPRLARATSIVTSSDVSDMKRSKPLKYAYEKEIVLYAHHKKLDYFTTECIYSPEAFRGTARALIKDLERIRPSAILDVVRSGEDMARLAPGGFVEPRKDQTNLSTRASNQDPCSAKSTGSDTKILGGRNTTEEDVGVTNGSTQQNQNLLSSTEVTSEARRIRSVPQQELRRCERCGYLTSQNLCKACVLLEALNKAKPKIEVTI